MSIFRHLSLYRHRMVKMDAVEKNIPSNRLITGAIVFIVGQLSPLLIPLVLSSDLGSGIKTALSGFLMLGVPELAIMLSIVIMGKAGFAFLKSKVGQFFKQYGPPETVSKTRYTIGLLLFIIPFIIGWLLPYFEHLIPRYDEYHLWINIPGDILLVLSLFVLGGDFWEKLRSLFIYNQTSIVESTQN